MKFLLAASSSGGHVFPCLALGKYLKEKGHTVTFIGFNNQFEENIYPREDRVLLDFPNSFSKAIKCKNRKIKEVYKVLKERIDENDVIIVFGGFISLIVSVVSLFRNKKYYIHEQNVSIGDSNRLCYIGCKRMFRTFRKNPFKKEVIVGNPTSDLIQNREVRFHNPIRVLFVFGSLGSTSLMQKTIEFINSYDISKYDITIINKLNNNLKTTNLLQNGLNIAKKGKNNIKILPFIDLRKDVNEYDVIFTRGGATTLSELVCSGAYIVSIPSPYVKHNHQMKNVMFLYKKGLISYLEEKKYTPSEINRILNEYSSSQDIRFNYFLKRKEFMSIDVMKKIEEYIIYDHKNKI